MLSLQPLDADLPIDRQLDVDAGPVVLVNHFKHDPVDEAAMVRAWTIDAEFMQSRSGFVSTQLHRSVGGSSSYLNYAVWESTAAFRSAFMHPDFQASLWKYPSSVVARPHLFEKVAVPNICAA